MGMNPARIISEIEYEHGLDPGTLASRAASKYVSGVRKRAVKRLRTAGLSYGEISQILRRHHTTIIALAGARTRG